MYYTRSALQVFCENTNATDQSRTALVPDHVIPIQSHWPKSDVWFVLQVVYKRTFSQQFSGPDFQPGTERGLREKAAQVTSCPSVFALSMWKIVFIITRSCRKLVFPFQKFGAK